MAQAFVEEIAASRHFKLFHKLQHCYRRVFCVSLREDLLTVYGLDDSLRPDTKSVVSELQKRDVAVSLVSGDDHKDWPPTRNPRSPNQIKVLPWRQAEARSIWDSYPNRSFSSGIRRIVQNFSWSFAYNTFAVLLAAGAFVNARIPPQYAGLVSSSASYQ
ncbi:hypothetical protein B0J14DRAFT_706614 [Halenospora varia]|nr:hypothetical protein B0J14DRAFT_706614 [Halenospora varia]